MLRLGEEQELTVVKKVDFGVYLAQEDHPEDKVLLPVKQVPEGTGAGDHLRVFLYRDSKDRLIATSAKPLIHLHEAAPLKVVSTGKIGAFMDMGLERDVLLPYREQTRKVQEGETILCALYIDKSSRLCVTMNVYPYLKSDSPYKKGDRVQGTVYEISQNFGAFVAVDDCYQGLIARKELYGKPPQIGDQITARVIHVQKDGKLDLSIREKTYVQMGKDAGKLLEQMRGMGGALPFTDKASPEQIRTETGMSKNEFKRAVGHLLKEGRITIGSDEIRLKSETDK